jgi:uncharacterized protein YkwD
LKRALLVLIKFFAFSLVAISLSACSLETESSTQPAKKEVSVTSEKSAEIDSSSFSSWAEEMLTRVNKVRLENGVKEVALCSSLMKTAQDYADLMMQTQHYDHTGPDGSSPSDRALQGGYNWENPSEPNPSGLIYQGIAENIAKGYQNVSMVMEGWINSPGHFRNLVASDAIHLGVGLAKNPNSVSETYWVQNFGFGGTC